MEAETELHFQHPVAAPAVCVILLSLACAIQAADVHPDADFCEFSTARDARAFGWNAEAVNGRPVLEVVADHKVGRYAVKARGKDFMGDWGTLVLLKEVDLSQAKKGDKIVFFIKQNASSAITLNIEGGLAYRSFPVARDEWVRVELDLDPAEWTWGHGQVPRWGRQKRFPFYAREFTSAEHYLIIDGLSFQIGGKQLPANIPPSQEPRPDESATARVSAAPPAQAMPPALTPLSDTWARMAAEKGLPQENTQAWLLGNADAFWAVSKRNGSIIGGWNGRKRERCLKTVAAEYFLEDKKSLVKAWENGDVVTGARLSANSQELRITCTNRALKNIRIAKTYSLRGGTLTREIRFASTLAAPFFFSCRSEARLGFPQSRSW